MKQRRSHRRLLLLLLWTSLTMIAVAGPQSADKSRVARAWPINILKDTFHVTGSTPSEVPIESLLQGCARRDCIPSIDQPKFIAASQATFLKDSDLVLAISLEGVHRAYPTSILVHHEIVNDTVGTQAIAITYCPLCGSGMAYSRVVGGEVTTFGVSGLLYESDLVMYDRGTETLWPQILGRGILGRRKGQTLTPLTISHVDWRTWRGQHPDTQVLSTDTGFNLKYGGDPYGDYASQPKTMFPIAHKDDRLHAKTVVYGVSINEKAIALTEGYLDANPATELELAGRRVSIQRKADGQVLAKDLKDGKELLVHRLFWFAWASTYPGTQLKTLPSIGK